MSSQILLTKSGFEALKKEYQKMLKIDVPALVEEIKKAKEDTNCQITENSEFIEASSNLDRLENKIRLLESKLQNAKVVDINDIKEDGKVKFGTTVELLRIEDNQKLTFQIVGEEESNIKEGKISYLSPLSNEMMGLEVGEYALCNEKEYEILDIRIEKQK